MVLPSAQTLAKRLGSIALTVREGVAAVVQKEKEVRFSTLLTGEGAELELTRP